MRKCCQVVRCKLVADPIEATLTFSAFTYSLSDLLLLPMPHLPTVAEQTSSIGLADGSNNRNGDMDEVTAVGKWEDEEERRFYEDVPDLKDFVPKSVLGIDHAPSDNPSFSRNENVTQEESRKRLEENDLLRLESEMEHLKVESSGANDEDEYV